MVSDRFRLWLARHKPAWWWSFQLWRARRRAWRYYKRTGYAGDAIPYTGVWRHFNAVDRDKILECLIKDAERFGLPPGTRYELRLKIPTQYGRDKGIAWVRLPEMDLEAEWGLSSRVHPIDMGGYYLIEQRTTGA